MRAKIMNEQQFNDFYGRVEYRCRDIVTGYSKYDYCLREMLMKTVILTSMSACDGKAFTSKQIEKLNALSTNLLNEHSKGDEKHE